MIDCDSHSHLRRVPKTNFQPNRDEHIKKLATADIHDASRRSLSRSRSFKVTNFDTITKRKPVSNFKVNNTKEAYCLVLFSS